MTTLGERIHELRLERRLSISQLADHAEVAKSYLSSIERGLKGNPSVQVLERIARELGVSLQTLINEPVDVDLETIDPDWLALAKEAMQSGVSKRQFQEFLEFQRWRSEHPEEEDES